MNKADQTSGSVLTAHGDKKLTITATGAVSSAPGRLCRILTGSGTGTITVYDNTSATGNPIWSGAASAGGSVEIDCPISVGIWVVLGATTTITVVYV